MQLKLSDVYPYSCTIVGQFLEAEGKVVAVMLPCSGMYIGLIISPVIPN